MAFLVPNFIYLLKKCATYFAFFFYCSLSFTQNIYQGHLTFNYSGTVNGDFSSTVEDTLLTGITINQVVNDTAFLFIASITQQNENNFDLFLGVLRDTIFPVQSRIWDIPGEGNESNPLSLESILIFMPDLDSSFVTDIFTIFTDTSTNLDSSEIFESLFTNFSENLYLGLDGSFEINNVSDSTLSGNFNTIMLKPAFHFPPHTVNINNGDFNFSAITNPALTVEKSNILEPVNFKILNAYPNPFNPKIILQFKCQKRFENFSAYIYDTKGSHVKTLFQGQIDQGLHNLYWEPKNMASGAYFFTIQTNHMKQTQKILYMK